LVFFANFQDYFFVGPPLENFLPTPLTMVGQKYFQGGGGKRAFGGKTYTKYNKINNNSKNFKGGKIASVISNHRFLNISCYRHLVL